VVEMLPSPTQTGNGQTGGTWMKKSELCRFPMK
jgi:hypothetical protein